MLTVGDGRFWTTPRRPLQHPDDVAVSAITVVDLAGAERSHNTDPKSTSPLPACHPPRRASSPWDRTMHPAAHIKETAAINKSLSALQNCITALKEKRRVPYNDDNLTKLFKIYFEGHGQAVRTRGKGGTGMDRKRAGETGKRRGRGRRGESQQTAIPLIFFA